VTNTGWGQEDVTMWILKATADFIKIYQVWKARDTSIAAKLRNFRSTVESVLLYGWESWTFTKRITARDLQTFINRCLGKMFNIFWSNVTSNAN
jgi:hypothetical protein